jgi:AcrR family transcriptional regulator
MSTGLDFEEYRMAPKRNKESGRPAGRAQRRLARAVRGRPINERIDAEVVAGVLHALMAGGYREVTIAGIAKSVKRARTSLYRRWPSTRHLVAYAVLSTLGVEPAPDLGSLRRDLVAAAETLRRGFSGPLGRALPGLIADMAHDPALARMISQQVLAPRRASIRGAFLRGVARGEVRRGIDVDVLIDLLIAPCYFRVLLGQGPVGRAFIASVVEHVLHAAAPA